MAIGRPSKLTPERKNKFIGAIRSGSFLNTACKWAGISDATYYLWMKKGREATRGEYREFFEAVQDAEAQAELNAVSKWQEFAGTNWQAYRDFLRYRFHENWTIAPTQVELTGAKGAPMEVEFSIERTTGRDEE